MFRIRLLRTASFRLAALYLALFTASALALGAFVYLSVRREILTDFDDRIAEETDALKRDFANGGRDRLAAIIEARKSDLLKYIQVICDDHLFWGEQLLERSKVVVK